MCVSGAMADSITLRSSVRVAAGETMVRLHQVAELEGSLADEHRDLVIMEMPATFEATELSVQQVRAALDKAGVQWGKVTLSGRHVTVRPSRTDTEPPLAMSAVSIQESAPVQRGERKEERVTFHAEVTIPQDSVASTIARLLCANLKANAGNVRFACDVADNDILTLSAQKAQFEVEPLTSMVADRVDVAVRIWSNGKIQQSRTISIYPTVQIGAAILLRDIQSGEIIRETDLDEQLQWLPVVRASQIAARMDAVNRVAGLNLKAGEPIRTRDIRRESLIKRGDAVVVRCVVGGTVITLQAEARSDGSEGDVIELRKLGEREIFQATVTGKGQASMNLNRQQAQQRATSSSST
jgi:flagella basal body P-ring formation protein FlgA